MYILIEEYQYNYEDIAKVLKGADLFHDSEGKVSLSYVGYFYNPDPDIHDCVFILPKVLLEGKPGKELVFGHITPKELIKAEDCTTLRPEEYSFIYNLSVWIYRAISVFRDHEYDRFGGNKTKPSIILYKRAPMMGRSRSKKSNTYLDVLLALQQWNKDNEHFVMFIMKNLHSGVNKINWSKTISKSHAILQANMSVSGRQDVAYLDYVNKKRQVNFDEELLIIYYSILDYIRRTYGFPVKIDVNFPLITGKKFERYINGYGKTRLKQIKYKYFSDKAITLWEYCFAFFEHPYRINMNVEQKEYLLAKSFHVVFEAIIDELIAGDQSLPSALIDQEDGKIVDHMYQYKELTNNDGDETIYYIGDSKYYKRGHKLDSNSIYKQFTYARNVVQWNIDLFNDGKEEEQVGHHKLRDDVTEGYNVIPNFFISAQQNKLIPEDDIHLTTDKKPYHLSRQFNNRLFDRDTFLLAHYDVNFLFVLALYGRNNKSAIIQWRSKVRKIFRDEIQAMLKEQFMFYAITAHPDVDSEAYIKQNFQSLLGKVYQPFDNSGEQHYYSLALRNPDKETNPIKKAEIEDENSSVLFQLSQSFYVAECPLGTDPRSLPESVMPIVHPTPHKEVPSMFLTIHYLENYSNTSFLIGGYRHEQLEWIFGRKGGKRDDAYNVRIGKAVHGGVIKSRDEIKHAKFVILYEFGKISEGSYRVFRVKNIGEMTKQHMIDTGYINPRHERYLCYFFDEEVSIGKLDLNKIIQDKKSRGGFFAEGEPIYLRGSELINYRSSLL